MCSQEDSLWSQLVGRALSCYSISFCYLWLMMGSWGIPVLTGRHGPVVRTVAPLPPPLLLGVQAWMYSLSFSASGVSFVPLPGVLWRPGRFKSMKCSQEHLAIDVWCMLMGIFPWHLIPPWWGVCQLVQHIPLFFVDFCSVFNAIYHHNISPWSFLKKFFGNIEKTPAQGCSLQHHLKW